MHGDFPRQGFSATIKVRLHAGHFGAVFLVAATLKTGRETHLHLRVDAAWELGIGMQIVHAAAHLEKIEGVAGKLFCHSARRKWPVVNVAPIETAKPHGDGRTGKFVFQMKLDQGRKTQSQAVAVGFPEGRAQQLIKQKSGLEV